MTDKLTLSAVLENIDLIQPREGCTFTRCSPSQLKTFNTDKAGGCKRKWWLNKVAGIEEEKNIKQQKTLAYGTVTHQLYEDYLLDQESNFHLWPEESQEPALLLNPDIADEVHWTWDAYQEAGQEYLDQLLEKHGAMEYDHSEPVLLPDQVEHEFEIQTPVGIQIDGFSDILVPGTVVDHKTTSSPRWAMKERDAMVDPQAIVYSKSNLEQYDVTRVEMVFNYVQKPGRSLPPKNWQLRLDMDKRHIDRQMDQIHLQLEDMARVAELQEYQQVEKPPTEIPCKKAFGGCPYYKICYGRVSVSSIPAFGKTTESTVNAKEIMAAKLAAKKAKQAEYSAQIEAQDDLIAQNSGQEPEPKAAPEIKSPKVTVEQPADTSALDAAKAEFLATGASNIAMLKTQEEKKAFVAWRAELRDAEGLNTPEARPNYNPEATVRDGEETDTLALLDLTPSMEEAIRAMGYSTAKEAAQIVTDDEAKAKFLDMKGIGPSKIEKLEAALKEAGVAMEAAPEKLDAGENGNIPDSAIDDVIDAATDPNEPSGTVEKPTEQPTEQPTVKPTNKPTEPAAGFVLLVGAVITKDNDPNASDVMYGYEIMNTINDYYLDNGGEEGHVGSIPFGGSKGYIADVLNRSIIAGRFNGKVIVIDKFEFGADIMVQCFSAHANSIIRGL